MYILPVVVTVVLIALDQFTKYLANQYLEPVGSVMVLQGILDLSFVKNRGAAFGILQGARWFFVALAVIVIIFIAVYYRSLPKTKPFGWVRLALIFIASGALGNGLDRLLYGAVTDFFHVRFVDFPVFNVADIYVVAGTILLTVLMIFFIKEEGGEEI